VPVIALTASTSEEDLAACRRSGMQEVLSKPVSMEVLVRALKACRASTPKLSIVS
jgi:CheY-like chemotaxis protein